MVMKQAYRQLAEPLERRTISVMAPKITGREGNGVLEHPSYDIKPLGNRLR